MPDAPDVHLAAELISFAITGADQGFGVLVVSHGSSAFAKRKENEDVEIIGTACVNNLISDGFKARNLGIPAQCFMLDYCGCKNHWHKEGFPTEINIGQLNHILGINKLRINEGLTGISGS